MAAGESKILTYYGFTRVALSISISANAAAAAPAQNVSASLVLNAAPLLAGDEREAISDFGLRNLAKSDGW